MDSGLALAIVAPAANQAVFLDGAAMRATGGQELARGGFVFTGGWAWILASRGFPAGLAAKDHVQAVGMPVLIFDNTIRSFDKRITNEEACSMETGPTIVTHHGCPQKSCGMSGPITGVVCAFIGLSLTNRKSD